MKNAYSTMYISTNIFCSRDYVYDTNPQTSVDISTRVKSFFPFSRNEADPITKDCTSDLTNENATRGTYNMSVSCEKVSVMTCAKMYVARPISFDDRQYRLINSRTLSF